MISYPEIENIVVTIDDAVKAFKRIYQNIQEKSKLSFLVKAKTVLSQQNYCEDLISLTIMKQVKHDGHVNRYSKKHDTTFLEMENIDDLAIYEIDATNNWISRRYSEIILIQQFIEIELSILQGKSKPNNLVEIKISNYLPHIKIIDTLYNGLFPTYIKIEKDEFKTHFTKSFVGKMTW